MEKLLNLQDQYKFPMGQVIFEQEPEAEVTFRMTNRKATRGMRIADYVSPEELQEHYDGLRELAFTDDQVGVVRDQIDKNYSESFLSYLAAFHLPEIAVSIDAENNDITAETTAPWNAASLWEIPMLSALPELYYPRYIAANGGSMAEVWNEGDRRLTQFIKLLKQHDVKWTEFGTRRRFGSGWQDHAVERFVSECPDQFLGTSNPWLAQKYDVPAVGTNAHEMPMVYAGISESKGGNPLDGQVKFLDDWLDRFPNMPVLLTDTFTSDFTLKALTRRHIEAIKTCRIDSGDERVIGRKIVDFWQSQRHAAPNLMFTNSLSAEKAVMLNNYFSGLAPTLFGIGGGSVNNMGFDQSHDLPTMNIVSKAVRVNGHGTVKLSDDSGKHMGLKDDVNRYKRMANAWRAGLDEEVAGAA